MSAIPGLLILLILAGLYVRRRIRRARRVGLLGAIVGVTKAVPPRRSGWRRYLKSLAAVLACWARTRKKRTMTPTEAMPLLRVAAYYGDEEAFARLVEMSGIRKSLSDLARKSGELRRRFGLAPPGDETTRPATSIPHHHGEEPFDL